MGIIKVTNRSITGITWTNAGNINYTVDEYTADVYRINIAANLPNLSYFTSLLTTDEIARGNKYYHLQDKNRFILSRGALRVILGNYINQNPSLLAFKIGPNKKPYVSSAPIKIEYNISHSGDWILLAISTSAVGADIEFENPEFNFADVLAGNFSEKEVAYLNNNNSASTFFTLWTRKEAITKCNGKGLDEGLKLVPCLDGDEIIDGEIIWQNEDMQVYTFTAHEQYRASIATAGKIKKLRFFDLYFNYLSSAVNLQLSQ